jgi:hypothetical protein
MGPHGQSGLNQKAALGVEATMLTRKVRVKNIEDSMLPVPFKFGMPP